MAGVAGAGFSFNRYADRDARSTARKKSQAELVDLLRRNIANPWQPPGGGAAGALSHDVIHVSVGEGPVAMPMTAKEILLAVTGRRPLGGVSATD